MSPRHKQGDVMDAKPKRKMTKWNVGKINLKPIFLPEAEFNQIKREIAEILYYYIQKPDKFEEKKEVVSSNS